MREPEWTFARAVLDEVVFAIDPANPNSVIGQIHFLDLDDGVRRTASYGRARNVEGTWDEIERLRALVCPETPTSSPQEVSLTVAIEFDRGMRFVGLRCRSEEYGQPRVVSAV